MDVRRTVATGDDSSLSFETMSDDTGDLLSLDVTEITNALVRPGGLWREVRVVAETGSTNADLLAQAGAGAAEGLVLVAEAQTAARGRQGRRWTSPPRAALTFSVLLRPRGVPPTMLGWVPLLAGVATAAAVRAVTGVDAALKWPNDVLADGGKLGGILAERSGPAVVVGIGINVWQDRAGLPGDAATSLLLEGTAGGAGRGGDGSTARVAGLRERLLAELLAGLSHWYLTWRDQSSPGDADACGLRREYVRRCITLGREVVVTMPGAEAISGTAAGVDWAGRLEVRTAHGRVSVTAGDVVHVRPHDQGK
jgi:BirA family transcriptional regulator, biotin operon repressor / biotin---[acetyl-CoA-carboxylase] ligase